MGVRQPGGSLASAGEDGILRYLRRRHPTVSRAVALGIGDDAALLDLPTGKGLIATTDLMVENVHFTLPETPPEALGYKLLAVNASDVAAMGGSPLFALLSLALPAQLDFEFLTRFTAGMRRGGRSFGVELIGGDTTVSRRGVFTSLTLLGRLAGARPLTRSAARPGDHLYVTGHLGASALGLTALCLDERKRTSPCVRRVIRRHLWPTPPLSWGAALARRGLCEAAMDLSDGLSTDLERFCRESAVGAELITHSLPVLAGTRRAADELGVGALEAALHGGEEYELLFSIQPARSAAVRKLAREMKVRITRIGTVRRGSRMVQVLPDGSRSPLVPSGWRHF